jgi:flagellar biosynthetic protein FlhB
VAASDKSQKTEKPTPRKLKEAREKGQVAKSADLAAWTGLLLTTVLLQITVQRGGTALTEILHAMGHTIANPTQEGAAAFFALAIGKAALIVAPMALSMMLIAIVVNIAQVGRPSSKRLKPDFKRLNPAKGLKRMVNPQALWELTKSLLKVAVLAAIAWPTVNGLAQALTGTGGSLTFIASAAAQTALHVIRNVAAAGLVIGAIDYAVQKRRVRKELMMTKQEVLEEHKRNEGDPRQKQALRSKQQAMSRNRMMRMVGTANLVVVNPTHFAVALKYDADRGAPEVVAKGADHLAARIRLEATKHGVPIVHEPAVTRALYKSCEVGQLIPIELYEAVAHLLAFIFSLRAKGRTDGYHEYGRPLVTTGAP